MMLAVLIVSVSVYVPLAGGINGGACVGRPASACFVQTGHVACGFGYPRGTVFVFNREQDYALHPIPVICKDRGGLISNRHIDLALVSNDVQRDLTIARNWGRRRLVAFVYPNMRAYQAELRTERRESRGDP